MSIAPYEVAIVTTNQKIAEQVEIGEQLYNQALQQGLDVVWDDRNERAGIKFNDMELIGVPYMIVLGKALADNQVEIKDALQGISYQVNIDQAIKKISDLVQLSKNT